MGKNHYSLTKMLNIIGIDPGSQLGIAVLQIEEHKIVNLVLTCTDLNKDLMINKHFGMDATYKRYANIRLTIKRLYEHYPFDYVGIETVFKHRFANAVIQLSSISAIIKDSIYNVNPLCEIHGIEPKRVKKVIGAGGSADKEAVAKAVKKLKEFKHLGEVTSHETDALAIAYVIYKQLITDKKV